jgi:hypothetical protein
LEQEADLNRRTDRISLSLPIQVLGTDSDGRAFRAEARTVLVTRHGGRITLARQLAPDMEVTIRYPRRDREARVRVRVSSGSYPDGHHYGIELLDPNENLWGIHFPSVREAASAVGRVLLECKNCQAQEVVCLDGMALELFQANRSLSRPCACSKAMTTWGEVLIPASAEAGAAAPTPRAAARTLAERRAEGWTIQACVQSEAFGDDLVWAQNPSKDGVRFLSERSYFEGAKIDIALPYQPGSGNVFIPAEIKWTSGAPEDGLILFGAAYLRRVRKATRFAAKMEAYVGILGVGLRLTGRIVDLSMTGVLMETSKTLEPGTNVRMGIEMGVDTLRTVAVVRRMVPGAGIAFEFAQMTQRDRQLLGRLIQSFKLVRP